MARIAHVIMMNDYPEHVCLGTPDQAEKMLAFLKQEHRAHMEQQLGRGLQYTPIWHIKTVRVSE